MGRGSFTTRGGDGMRSSRRSQAAVALMVLGGGVAGGAGSAGARPASKHAAPVKIGYISLGEQIPFVALVTKGMRKAAKENGVNLLVCDSQIDAQKAINCAAQFKTQGVKG